MSGLGFCAIWHFSDELYVSISSRKLDLSAVGFALCVCGSRCFWWSCIFVCDCFGSATVSILSFRRLLSWFCNYLNPFLRLALSQMSLVLILQLSKPCPLWADSSSAVPWPGSTGILTRSFIGWLFSGCPLSRFYS